MKKLPVGIQRFRKIIEQDYLYVDKTKVLYNIVNTGELYFLSRPRRFGKSLLVSTFEELFSGDKALFEGLDITKTDWEWPTHPVLSFNFAKLGNKVGNLEELLKEQLEEKAQTHGITLKKQALAQQVDELVSCLSKKDKPVVFLIDEYDKPIIDFITDIPKADKNREVLRNFFSPLKDLEAQGHLRFLFITGISKFSKVSLFSDLNNLTDLMLARKAVSLTGITQEELERDFAPHIQHSAELLSMSESELLANMKLWYNGYSYDGKTFLYNPYSLLNFFDTGRFGNFWFASGTPTFLVNVIRNDNMGVHEIEEKEIEEIVFDKFSIEEPDIYNLLFQTGYLTIKNRRREGVLFLYQLGFPNEEVRQSFAKNLLEGYAHKTSSTISDALWKIKAALAQGNVETFIRQLKILLADIPYHLWPRQSAQEEMDEEKLFTAWEGYFHTIIYLITIFLDLSAHCEVAKHKGRIDLLVETGKYLYLMEFKIRCSC